MLTKLKKNLFFMRNKLLILAGLIEGNILPFEDEIYQKLDNVYFSGIPLSMYFMYLKPLPGLPGQCYERSLWLTMVMPGSILVRGLIKDLEFRYCKEEAGHGWIEKEGWVYDPTLQHKFKRDLYYKLYEPSCVTYYTGEEYTTAPAYQEIMSTTLTDYMKGGKKRHELIMSIPLIRGIAELTPNSDFLKKLNEHLALIGYDEQEILNELNDDIRNLNSQPKK